MRSRVRSRRGHRHPVRHLPGRPRPHRAARRGTHPGAAGNPGVKPSMDIPDGDLVRLARDGDPAAFRLLVERHLPDRPAPARPGCARGPRTSADHAVQDVLPAGLHRAGPAARPRPVRRLAGRHPRQRLPRPAAPRAAHPARRLAREPAPGLRRQPMPSAERPGPRRRARPRGQPASPPGSARPSPAFYYADQPAGQVAATPGAAKASLHKARRRLREHITAHRPDLIPALSPENPHDRCPHRARRPRSR